MKNEKMLNQKKEKNAKSKKRKNASQVNKLSLFAQLFR